MLSVPLMVICSAFVHVLCGKEFKMSNNGATVNPQGQDVYDFEFMDTACRESVGMEYEPAAIESDDENTQAFNLCASHGGTCFIGLVREDVGQINWYWRDDKQSDFVYNNWAGSEGQQAGSEACVVIYNNEPTWHDIGCQHAGPLICQKKAVCEAFAIDSFVSGCSNEFADSNADIEANAALIAENSAGDTARDTAIQANTDLIGENSAADSGRDAAIAANTARTESNDVDITDLYRQFDVFASGQAAHAVAGGLDEFETSFFNSNDIFLMISLVINVCLFFSWCYMVNQSRKDAGYNKVKMYTESDADQPLT
jgi:hypothetical protein